MARQAHELLPSEIARIATTLSGEATSGGISTKAILLQLDLSSGSFPPNLAPDDFWLRVTQAVYAGRSQSAGFRSDAVAHLINKVAQQLVGNEELLQLAYRIGKGSSENKEGKAVVFLSYATPDRSAVDRLYQSIVEQDPSIETFQDHRAIHSGMEWLQQIRSAAGRASVFACWVTTNYLNSAFCNYEVGLAETQGSLIIPVWLNGVKSNEAPFYLAGRQGIDVKSPIDFHTIAANIVAAVRC